MSPTTPLDIPTATRGGLRVSAHVVFRPKIGLCFELKSKAGTENGKQLGSSRVRPLPGPDPEAYYPKTAALWMVVLPFLLTTAVALNANQETLAAWFVSTKKALAKLRGAQEGSAVW